MRCKGCGTDCPKLFNAEMGIHFPGREGLTKPLVLVFPQVLVCLNCGFAEFTVPETQLRVLEDGVNKEGGPGVQVAS